MESLDVESIESFNFGVLVISYTEENQSDYKIPIYSKNLETVTIEPLDMEAIINRLLKNKNYFDFCKECNDYNVKGYMHNDDICDSCAQVKFGFDH